MGVQRLIGLGFGGYQGWDDTAAEADFRVTGGAGKQTGGGGTPGTQGGGADDQMNQLIQLLTGQTGKALEFDEPAARGVAEEKLGPEYEELLQDYLTEVTIGQERSVADLASGLGLAGARREEYMGDIQRQSPLIQEQIGGQAADRGLYFSGGREEQQKLQLEKEGRQKGTYDREYEYKVQQAELEQKRYLENVEREKKTRERELARDRERAITGHMATQQIEQIAGYS